jgi:hypothetical protein
MIVKTFRAFNESKEIDGDNFDILMDVTEAMKDKDNIRVDKNSRDITINIFTDGKFKQYDSCRTYYMMQANFNPNFFVAEVNIPDTSKTKGSEFFPLKLNKEDVHQYILLTGEIRDKLNLDPPYYLAVWYRDDDKQTTLPSFSPSVDIKNL